MDVMTVALSGSDGQIESVQTFDTVRTFVKGVAVGDINQDGILDLLQTTSNLQNEFLIAYVSQGSTDLSTYQRTVMDQSRSVGEGFGGLSWLILTRTIFLT